MCNLLSTYSLCLVVQLQWFPSSMHHCDSWDIYCIYNSVLLQGKILESTVFVVPCCLCYLVFHSGMFTCTNNVRPVGNIQYLSL